MANQNKNNKQNVTNGVANTIKNGADAVFDAAHNTLDATENIAMNAVDQTGKAINKTANSFKQKGQNDQQQNNQ